MDTLTIYSIYENPKDYPEKFVVRKWFIKSTSKQPFPEVTPHCIADTLEEARHSLSKEGPLVKLMPNSDDDPCIVENWL